MVKLYDLLGFDEVWFGEHHSGGCELIVDPLTFIAHRIFAPFDGVAVRTRPSQHAQGHIKWWRPPALAAGQRPASSQLNRGRSADVHPKLGHDARAAGARASAHPRCHGAGVREPGARHGRRQNARAGGVDHSSEAAVRSAGRSP